MAQQIGVCSMRGANAYRADYLTPEMFGAVGGGVIDDFVALQACFDAVPADGCKILFTKNYYTSLPLDISSYTTLACSSYYKWAGGLIGGVGALPLINIPAGVGGLRFSGMTFFGQGDAIHAAVSGIDIAVDHCWNMGAGYLISGAYTNLQINDIVVEFGGVINCGSGNYINVSNVLLYHPLITSFLVTGAGNDINLNNVNVELCDDVGQIFDIEHWNSVNLSNINFSKVPAEVGRITNTNLFHGIKRLNINGFNINDCMSGASSSGLYVDQCSDVSIKGYKTIHAVYADSHYYGAAFIDCDRVDFEGIIEGVRGIGLIVHDVNTFDFKLFLTKCQLNGIYIEGTSKGRFNGGDISVCGKNDAASPLIFHAGTERVWFNGTRINGAGAGIYSNHCILLNLGSIGRFVDCNFTAGGIGVDAGGAGTLETIHNINL